MEEESDNTMSGHWALTRGKEDVCRGEGFLG